LSICATFQNTALQLSNERANCGEEHSIFILAPSIKIVIFLQR